MTGLARHVPARVREVLAEARSRIPFGAGGTTIDRGAHINIYVGNLPFNYDSAALESLFSSYGAVQSASVISDRDTGRSRGFGFVEMADEDGRRAIEELNGKDVDGRRLTVNEARPRNDGGGRRGGGGGRFGGDRRR